MRAPSEAANSNSAKETVYYSAAIQGDIPIVFLPEVHEIEIVFLWTHLLPRNILFVGEKDLLHEVAAKQLSKNRFKNMTPEHKKSRTLPHACTRGSDQEPDPETTEKRPAETETQCSCWYFEFWIKRNF